MTDTVSSRSTQQVVICPNPIFIIGSPRSGTTALAEALGRHSGMSYSCEGHIFHRLFGSTLLDDVYEYGMGTNKRWLARHQVTREEFLQATGMGLNALYASRSAGRRWIEKTPENTLIVGLLAEMFPGALFVHIVRDGRCVVHSRMSIPEVATTPQEFRRSCQLWVRSVEGAMAFQAQYQNRCLTVRNEDLVRDAASSVRRILTFLDAPYEREVAECFRRTRVNSSFVDRPPGPPSPDDPSEPWRTWSVEQRRDFLEVAGVSMLTLGFTSTEEIQRMVHDAGGVDRTSQTPRWLKPITDYLTRQAAQRGVRRGVDQDGRVLVISKGDEELLELEGRIGMHFPQTEEGIYAGEYPADSQEAIDQLEALRARGAGYLLIPAPAFWWLEYYAGFAQHLHSRYHCLWQDEELILYALEPA